MDHLVQYSNVDHDSRFQSLAKEQDSIRQTLSQLSTNVNELFSLNKSIENEIKVTVTSINKVPALNAPAPVPALTPVDRSC